MTEKLSSRSFEQNAVSTDAFANGSVTAAKINSATITLDKLHANVISRLSNSLRIQTVFHGNGVANIAGGETVWVHGIGFTPNSAVFVEKVGCATTFVDAFKIYFVTPPAAPGSYTIYVDNFDGTVGSKTNAITYSDFSAISWVSPRVLPIATTNSFYSYQLVAYGLGPVDFSLVPGTGLPPGIILFGNGLITGTSLWVSAANVITTPASANITFSVKAVDSAGKQSTQEFLIPNRGGVRVYYLVPSNLSTANVVSTAAGTSVALIGDGFKSNANVVLAGNTYLTTVSNGFFLSFTTNFTAQGSYTITVNNRDGTYANNFVLSFGHAPVWTTPSGNLITAVEDSSINVNVSVSITTESNLNLVAYSLTNGSLPPGLTLSSNTGVITGNLIGNSGGLYQFNIVATTVQGLSSGERTFTANIIPIPRITSIVFPSGSIAANIGGNEIITVVGNNFVTLSRVVISNIAQNTTFINSTTLQFTTQSRVAGNYLIGVQNYTTTNSYIISTPGIYYFSSIDATANVTVKIWGAGGGNNTTGFGGAGGSGGYSSGDISFQSGTSYIAVVGQAGRSSGPSRLILGGGGTGAVTPVGTSGSGGGYTGIFANEISQAGAVIMAGGGGGGAVGTVGGSGAAYGAGGGGGGLLAQNGITGGLSPQFQPGGGGGGQVVGGIGGVDTNGNVFGESGSALQGGNAYNLTTPGQNLRAGGAGGGGYFGGGAGAVTAFYFGGGGGGGGGGYLSPSLVSNGISQGSSTLEPFNARDNTRGNAGSANTDGAVVFGNIQGLTTLQGGQFETILTGLGTNIAFRYSSPPNWVTSTGNIGLGVEGLIFSSNIRGNSDSAITYSIFSGNLPPNLSLNTVTGNITGTLTSDSSVGLWTFTALVTDAESQRSFRDFSISVLSVPRVTSIVYPTAVPVLKTPGNQTVAVIGRNYITGASVYIANTAQISTVINSNFISFTTNVRSSGTLPLSVVNPNQLRSSNVSVRVNPPMTWVSTGNLIAYGFVSSNVNETFVTRVVANSQSPVTYSITSAQPDFLQFFSNGYIVIRSNTSLSTVIPGINFINNYLNDQDLYVDNKLIPTVFSVRAVNADLDVLTANFSIIFVARPTITSINTIFSGNTSNLSIAYSSGADSLLITGTNFRNRAKLYVANTVVTTAVFSSSSCIFSAPPNPPGSATVTVVNEDGTTASTTITYIQAPVVAFADNYYNMFAQRSFSVNLGSSFKSSRPLTYSVTGRFHPNLTVKTIPDITSSYINDYDIIPTSTFISGTVNNFASAVSANSFSLIGTDEYGKTITSNHTIVEYNSAVVGSLWVQHYFSPGYNIPTVGNLASPGNIAIEVNSNEFSAMVIGSALTDATTVFIGNSAVSSYTFPNNSMLTFSFPNVSTASRTTLTIQHYERVLYRANIIYYTPVTGNSFYETAGTFSWVAPANVFYVHAAAIGGGASAGSGPYGSGGGGGGLGWRNFIPVVPGTTYTVVVGAGGGAVASNLVPCSSGNDGSDSWFFSNTILLGGGGLTSRACEIGGIGGRFIGTGGGTGGNGGGGNIYLGGEVGGGGGAAGSYNGAGSPGGLGFGATGTTQVSFTSAGVFSWTAPATAVFATVYVWGAGGAGGRPGGWGFGSSGGAGGAARGNIIVVPGATYGITVGEGGNYNSGVNPIIGGGGGASPTGADNSYGGGGGGYSGIFLGNVRTQSTAIMIAGGGGGGGSSRAGTGNQGGGGGGFVGQDGGSPYDNKPNYRGRRATQFAPGTDSSNDSVGSQGLQGALTGGGTRVGSYGGAGGSGYWGGTAGGYSEPNTMAGGGGGSGFINANLVTGGQLTAGNLTIVGDSGNAFRGTAGNPGAASTAGTPGSVIIIWSTIYPGPDGISGGGSGGAGGGNPVGNSTGGGGGGGGGGTGLILGQLRPGAAITTISLGGNPGSQGNIGGNGQNGTVGPFNGGVGGSPGGGGGYGAKTGGTGGAGAVGAVRILWGPRIRWPNTNTR